MMNWWLHRLRPKRRPTRSSSKMSSRDSASKVTKRSLRNPDGGKYNYCDSILKIMIVVVEIVVVVSDQQCSELSAVLH